MSLSDVYGIPVSTAATLARTSREAAPRGFSFWGALAGTAFDVDIRAHLSRVPSVDGAVCSAGASASFRVRPDLRTFVRRGRMVQPRSGCAGSLGLCPKDLALRGLTDLLRPRLPALRPSLLYPQDETQRFVPGVSTGTSGAATNATCAAHRQKTVAHVSLVSVVRTIR
jgi:hypothetical protein